MLTKVLAMTLAAAAMGATAAYAEVGASQTCEATSFRVYFQAGATQLNSDAEKLIAAASRDVAGCADLNVRMTPSNGESQASLMRSAAIAAEMRQHGLDVNVPMPHMANYSQARAAGPEYIEVRMTPDNGEAL